ncbi:hypothetical protein EDD39_3659 [Kitasatospora cineracea]|uniref:Uncharacterized protein n=2 Tax=Kitasatospora cineracea TaxID=88074 RepID=A0A8G1XGB8_9ACTN|nr:hypothetical protein EDD39_3659 [Kitasatospora cineracea]
MASGTAAPANASASMVSGSRAKAVRSARSPGTIRLACSKRHATGAAARGRPSKALLDRERIAARRRSPCARRDATREAWARSCRAAFAARPRSVLLLTSSLAFAPEVLEQYERAVAPLP